MLPTSGAWQLKQVVAEGRAPELFAHVREVGERQAQAAVFLGQRRGPEAALLRLRAHGMERGEEGSEALAKLALERDEIIFHDAPDLLDDRPDTRAPFDVHMELSFGTKRGDELRVTEVRRRVETERSPLGAHPR